MGDKREITKLEKQIINDIMSRSNYNQEKATEIAKAMIDFGYTIHEQDYYRLKKENKELRKAIKQWNISGGNLLKENTKLKKAIEILEEEPAILKIPFEDWEYDKEQNLYYYITKTYEYSCDYGEYFWETVKYIYSEENFKLLKEVF